MTRPPLPTTADAVAASVACARALGLPHEDPVVVAEGYSVRVRLDPAPVITRVVTTGRTLRGDPLPWMQREVRATTALAAAGAPVVPPWSDPGPHTASGLDVSLWTWCPPVDGDITPVELAHLLRELHDALTHVDLDLPLLVGPLTDIATALELSSDPVLHEAAADLLPRVQTWPRRPLHGDAHTGNVLRTRDGLRWLDLEDVCVGPLEWDFASRTITQEVVDAYPGRLDPQLLAECRDLRRLQILACLVTDEEQPADLYAEVTRALSSRRGSPR